MLWKSEVNTIVTSVYLQQVPKRWVEVRDYAHPPPPKFSENEAHQDSKRNDKNSCITCKAFILVLFDL